MLIIEKKNYNERLDNIPAPRSHTRIFRCEQDKICTNSEKKKMHINQGIRH